MKASFEKIKWLRVFMYFLIIPGFLAAGHISNGQDYVNPVIIDLIKVIQNERDVPISQFVDSLVYIPLETTPESGISYIRKIFLTDKYIIIRHDSPGSSSPLLLFDRKSGKFIRPLGKKGRGPEEYTIPLDCFYNPYDKKIYTYGSMKSFVKTYNLDGKYIESFVTPLINEASVNEHLPIDAFIDSENFAGYITNSTGQVRKKLILFSRVKVKASFSNYDTWPSDQVTISQDPLFFTWQKQVSFKERSNDTVFNISGNKLIPKFVLYTGKLRYPNKLSREEAVEQLTKPKDYLETRMIFENTDYLFFDLGFRYKPAKDKPTAFQLSHNLCIFDKRTKNTLVCGNEADNNSGLSDDINNFMSVTPLTITELNELVGVLQAAEINKWKAENPDKSVKLASKLPWISNINELDNPVIVIGKCKN